jgi:hypothetical protein
MQFQDEQSETELGSLHSFDVGGQILSRTRALRGYQAGLAAGGREEPPLAR